MRSALCWHTRSNSAVNQTTFVTHFNLFLCACVCVQVFVQQLISPHHREVFVFFFLQDAFTIETRRPSRTVSAPPSLSLLAEAAAVATAQFFVSICFFFFTINCRPEEKTTKLKRKKEGNGRRHNLDRRYLPESPNWGFQTFYPQHLSRGCFTDSSKHHNFDPPAFTKKTNQLKLPPPFRLDRLPIR